MLYNTLACCDIWYIATGQFFLPYFYWLLKQPHQQKVDLVYCHDETFIFFYIVLYCTERRGKTSVTPDVWQSYGFATRKTGTGLG